MSHGTHSTQGVIHGTHGTLYVTEQMNQYSDNLKGGIEYLNI